MYNIKTELIMKYLEDGENKNISLMAKNLKMPRTTLIYYISKLENENLIYKKRGFIIKNKELAIEVSTNDKININKKIKIKISAVAAKHIEKNDVIFIDSGSTTAYLSNYIKNMDIVIYTNNIYFINLMGKMNSKAKIRILPGNLYSKTLSIVGSETIDKINNIKFDKSFIGIDSKLDDVYFTSNDFEQNIKNAAIRNSNEVFFLFEKKKINLNGFKYKITINKKANEMIF